MFDLLKNWIRKSSICMEGFKGLNEWKSMFEEFVTWYKSEAAEIYELHERAAPDAMGNFGHMKFGHSK